MTDFNQQVNQAKDILNLEEKDVKQLPSMLNTLTILTYIGCGLGVLGAFYNYATIGTSYELLKGMTNNANELSGGDNKFLSTVLSGSIDIIRKSYENRVLILVLTLVALVLCFYGAMQMRNLKQQGFSVYVIGEILPVAVTFFLIGGSALAGFTLVTSALVPVVFIILYATQRKYLVK